MISSEVKTPINRNSTTSRHSKNSLTKNFMESQLISIHVGTSNTDKKTKNREMGSTPNNIATQWGIGLELN